ncbi:hypothetical protein HYFRA_00005737, partial [Hymenoscyphus fraxineus]
MPNTEEDQTRLLLKKRATLTAALQSEPYDLITYLQRAQVHADLGYPDLAVGDYYRALLLTDEVANEGFEYHEQAVEALREQCRSGESNGEGEDEWQVPEMLKWKGDYKDRSEGLGEVPKSGDINGRFTNGEKSSDAGSKEEERRELIVRLASIKCYRGLALNLLLCGCLKSAYDFCLRGLAIANDDGDLNQRKDYILLMAKRRLKVDEVDISSLPDQGVVRREAYPWNTHEPDRFSQESLDTLSKELSVCAPKLEVRVTELPILLEAYKESDNFGITPTIKQLGLFAKEDIEPGEEILHEISLLAANNLLKESLCDACSSSLPELSMDSEVVACPDCDDIMFCNEECLSLAQESYHPAVCDKDLDTIAKDPDPAEKPFALYLLLLGRALAMSETQSIHPLDLKEVKYIWGDFLPSSVNAVPLSPSSEPPPIWTLPFSFAGNVSGPLHLLEKMDIDVFASIESYDLWIFNTLYAKFRGTASARVNKKTGHPEVAAVHPLWCLANHDCDPNVSWKWGARMKFWCRKERIGGRKGGVRKGEEILNHYTDVELKVKERREWALGSLGGF